MEQKINFIDIPDMHVILDTIKEKCPHKGIVKYSDEYVLENIFYVLKHVSTWRSLQLLHTNEKKNHYSTILKRFHKWVKNDVFVESKILKNNLFNKFDEHSELLLFIDSTSIVNRYGIDCLGIGENRKKYVSKITLVCDKEKNVYDVQMHEGNVHDLHAIEPFVETITKQIKYKSIDIAGDKAYKLNKIMLDKIKEKNVTMRVANRKNQKIKTSEETKKILKGRYIIEHKNSDIKAFDRVQTRKDKYARNYLSFVYLALCIKFVYS